MKRVQRNLTRSSRRAGFTLVELIMVIAVIATLIALLLPALGSVRETMRVTEVRQEISQIEAAIADFALKLGSEPPSSITIYETQAGWNSDPESRAKIRKLWPKFDFSVTRNIDGGSLTSYTLRGDQCLCFFLGGQLLNGGTDSAQFVGFSGDPTNPFASAASAAASTTRIGPFFKFDMGRIQDSASSSYSAPLNIFPVYFDPYPDQTNPYLYASSYDGLGYDDSSTASDVATAASDINLGDMNPEFRVYRIDTKAMATDPDPAAWNPDGYQIISPGPDGAYGIGGPYKPDSTIKLPARLQNGGSDVADANRSDERDNITNFTSGKLDF